MDWLVDTNILLRLAENGHPMERLAQAALGIIRSRGDRPCIVLQNLIEFWSVTTRPRDFNGFGFTQAQVESEVRRIEFLFPLLAESPAVNHEWRRLVRAYPIAGKNIHDTRLVALMIANKVTHLLTFNAGDFGRYSEIQVVEPCRTAEVGADSPEVMRLR